MLHSPFHTPTWLHHACVLIVAALGMASCVHEMPDAGDTPLPPGPPPAAPGRLVLDYPDTEMPLLTTLEVGTTARSGAGDVDSRHIIKVFADDVEGPAPSRNNLTEVASVVINDAEDAATRRREIDLPLPAGTYRYIVWTDYGRGDADLYYETADFSEIVLKGERRDGLLFHEGNTPRRDAFRGEGRFTVDAAGQFTVPGEAQAEPMAEAVIEMRRPLARFVFVATDLDDFLSRVPSRQKSGGRSTDLAAYRIVMRYTGYMPSALNAFTDRPADSVTGAAVEGRISVIDAEPGTAELGWDYVFTGPRESAVQVALDVYDRSTGERVASTPAVTVPVQRNRLTIVRGRFLTSAAGSSVGIDPGFNGDFNIEIR